MNRDLIAMDAGSVASKRPPEVSLLAEVLRLAIVDARTLNRRGEHVYPDAVRFVARRQSIAMFDLIAEVVFDMPGPALADRIAKEGVDAIWRRLSRSNSFRAAGGA